MLGGMPLVPLAATLSVAGVAVAGAVAAGAVVATGNLGVAGSPGPGAPGLVASAGPAGPVAPAAAPALPTLARSAPPGIPRARGERFRWPLDPAPRVLRRFSVGPYRWSPGHRGVDLDTVAGRTVLAAGAGIVTFAGRVAGRGVVVVAHGAGLRTTYEPVTALVRRGVSTAAGTPIGTVESVPGHCRGPCLHWGALRGAVYVDPLSLLGPPALPVLLPDDGSVS
jgi:murein DD-endopeptidase MepM/ murein hydrolase activator NlpD